MRLLQYNDDGEFSLTRFSSDSTPPYAILSHTWGPEEVTFSDMVHRNGKSKAGYDKIKFCGEQARRDGLQYFWIDTCCIDKSYTAELDQAINSMFRWYRNAAECYVYLSDISRVTVDTNDHSTEPSWMSAFRQSRWFTRGWTLQELIAPRSVEFFSKVGDFLGDKRSLDRDICKITGIPAKVLQENALSDISIVERLAWAENRETTVREDKAYSLLGILGVSMPLMYGEGEESALRRLHNEIDKSSKEFNNLPERIREDGRAIEAPENHLNEMFVTVLKNSISSDYTTEEKKELYNVLKYTLGSVVILLSPLSLSSLSRLLQLSKGGIDQTLANLSTILDIPEDRSQPLLLRHPSFCDFLFDESRREDANFWVDEKQAHRILADRCIGLMSTSLVGNICGVTGPGTFVTDIERSRIKECLPPELEYACLYWVQHLEKSGAQLYDNDKVYQFLQEHLLHWLEALSWMGKVSEGILAILSLEARISANKSPNFYAFVHDAKRFALYNRSVIEQAPLQLYCSSLVFAPEKSIIRRLFEEYIPLWIRKSKAQADWSSTLQTLESHSGPITSIAFSPDGKQIVSGSWDRIVRLWDAVTGAALQTLEGHSSSVNSVAFSPDGKQIVSGCNGGIIRLWDVATGAALQKLESHSYNINSVAFSPDGKKVVSGSRNRIVELWDTVTGAALQTLRGHSDSVNSVSFSPDGKQVVSGSKDTTIRLWDAATGAALQKLTGNYSVNSVAFSPNGKQILSGSDDGIIRLWDTATGAALQTIQGDSMPIRSVAFSPDGKLIGSGSGLSTVRIWDTVTGVELHNLEGSGGSVNPVAFSPDSKQVVTGQYEGILRRCDLVINVGWQTLEGRSIDEAGRLKLIAFSPDGKQFVSVPYSGTIQLWDVATGAVLHDLEGHSNSVNSVAFSPDGKQIVSGSYDSTVRLWDVATGAALQILEGHSSLVNSVAFSPDSKKVVSGSYDMTVRLWDVATGAELQNLEGHSKSVNSVAFSPDGKQIVSGSYDSTVRLWDVATGAALQNLEDHSNSVDSVAFSPDGKQIVSWPSDSRDDRIVRLWDTVTGAALKTLKYGSSPIESVEFSPDSKVKPKLVVSNNWITEKGLRILWLPPEYRATCVAVWNRCIVLGSSSGRISVLEFKEWSEIMRWETLGKKHPDAIDGMADTATLYKQDLSNSYVSLQTPQSTLASGVFEDDKRLLDKNFAALAEEDPIWLQELREHGYTTEEIARLLATEKNDSPWIYFEPREPLSEAIIPDHHVALCVHNGGQEVRHGSESIYHTRMDGKDDPLSLVADNDSLAYIEEFCGIAGVVPNTRDLSKQAGSIKFVEGDDGTLTASVIFRSGHHSDSNAEEKSGLPNHDDTAQPEVAVEQSRNILQALQNLCSAIAHAQRSEICCDSFTILEFNSIASTQEVIIELHRIQVSAVLGLLSNFTAFTTNLGSEDESILMSDILDFGQDIFQEATLSSFTVSTFQGILDFYSLAVQFLSLGFLSYIKAHVGAIKPFFLDTSLSVIKLFGLQDWERQPPRLTASLFHLTCLDGMIQNPVLVFGDDWAREHNTKRSYDLLASPEDFMDTWGPGQFITSTSTAGTQNLTAIMIGGGVVKPTADNKMVLHWSNDVEPRHKFSVCFSSTEKVLIAGDVQVNGACLTNKNERWSSFMSSLANLGTTPDYWKFTELQAGVALVGGQQLIGGQVQFNKTWTWHPGNSWKRQQLGLIVNELPFSELDRPWGLQVSACTGVARRVPLRLLLADTMPSFAANLASASDWPTLKKQGIIEALKQGSQNLKQWYDGLRKLSNFEDLQILTNRLIRYILLVLRNTGIDRDHTTFLIACPQDSTTGQPISMCLPVPCENASLWAKILTDSENCATFAYMTSLCLESREHKCQQTNPWHCPSLDTAVQRLRPWKEPITTPPQAWNLEANSLYWIGMPESGLQARVVKSPNSPFPRLYVSKSRVPEKTRARLRLPSGFFGPKRERLREKQIEAWPAEDVLILSQ